MTFSKSYNHWLLFKAWKPRNSLMEVTWEEMKLAYRRYCDINDFHPHIDPMPAFFAFVGIDSKWAKDHPHGDTVSDLSGRAANRIRALASPHYLALYKAMQELQDDPD